MILLCYERNCETDELSLAQSSKSITAQPGTALVCTTCCIWYRSPVYVYTHRAVLKQGRISPARGWDSSDKSYQSAKFYSINPSCHQPALQARGPVLLWMPNVLWSQARWWGCCFHSTLEWQTLESRQWWLSSQSSVLTKRSKKGSNPAAQHIVRGGAVSAQHGDYVGQLPGYPTGISAGLGKTELNERHTQDFIQTMRTIRTPGRKSF